MSRRGAVVASTAVAMASSAELEQTGLLKMRELRDALSGPGGHVPVTRPTLIKEKGGSGGGGGGDQDGDLALMGRGKRTEEETVATVTQMLCF